MPLPCSSDSIVSLTPPSASTFVAAPHTRPQVPFEFATGTLDLTPAVARNLSFGSVVEQAVSASGLSVALVTDYLATNPPVPPAPSANSNLPTMVQGRSQLTDEFQTGPTLDRWLIEDNGSQAAIAALSPYGLSGADHQKTTRDVQERTSAEQHQQHAIASPSRIGTPTDRLPPDDDRRAARRGDDREQITRRAVPTTTNSSPVDGPRTRSEVDARNGTDRLAAQQPTAATMLHIAFIGDSTAPQSIRSHAAINRVNTGVDATGRPNASARLIDHRAVSSDAPLSAGALLHHTSPTLPASAGDVEGLSTVTYGNLSSGHEPGTLRDDSVASPDPEAHGSGDNEPIQHSRSLDPQPLNGTTDEPRFTSLRHDPPRDAPAKPAVDLLRRVPRSNESGPSIEVNDSLSDIETNDRCTTDMTLPAATLRPRLTSSGVGEGPGPAAGSSESHRSPETTISTDGSRQLHESRFSEDRLVVDPPGSRLERPTRTGAAVRTILPEPTALQPIQVAKPPVHASVQTPLLAEAAEQALTEPASQPPTNSADVRTAAAFEADSLPRPASRDAGGIGPHHSDASPREHATSPESPEPAFAPQDSSRSVVMPDRSPESHSIAASLVPRVLAHVRRISESSSSLVDIELTPPALGPLNIQVEKTRRGLSVRIVAATAATLALLESGRDEIVSALVAGSNRAIDFAATSSNSDQPGRQKQAAPVESIGDDTPARPRGTSTPSPPDANNSESDLDRLA